MGTSGVPTRIVVLVLGLETQFWVLKIKKVIVCFLFKLLVKENKKMGQDMNTSRKV